MENQREPKESLLKRIAEFVGDFFSEEFYTSQGIGYLSPKMRRNLYYEISKPI